MPRDETDQSKAARIRLESHQALHRRDLECGWDTHGDNYCGAPATLLYPCTVYDPEDLVEGKQATRLACLAFCPDHDPHRLV
jgi:hypothetical protein